MNIRSTTRQKPVMFCSKVVALILIFVFACPIKTLAKVPELRANEDTQSVAIPSEPNTPIVLPPFEMVPRTTSGNSNPSKNKVIIEPGDGGGVTKIDISDAVVPDEKIDNELPPPLPLLPPDGVTKNIDTVPLSLNRSAKADLSSGALVYSYELGLPPGRNGLTPSLALTYNSNNRENDSYMGFGWVFDIPSVTRLNRHGSDNIYEYDDFTSSMSGELASTTGSSFIAKVDNGDFLNYSFENNYWTVYDKEGTRYLFGATTTARQNDPNNSSNVYRWMLEEVRDTNDNYIRYEYFKDAGQIYPSKIIYTGNGSTDGIFEVLFNKTACEMSLTMFHPGFKLKTNYCITDVEIKENNQWVKKYEFTRDVSDASSVRKVLTSVTESGRDLDTMTVSEKVPTVFVYKRRGDIAWQEDGQNWRLPYWYADDGHSSLMQVRDLNGDAYPDAIHYIETSDPDCDYQDTYINNAQGGWIQANCPTEWFPPEYIGADNTVFKDNGVRFFDYDGDNLTDLVRSYTTENGDHVTSSEVYRNTGSSTNPWVLTDVEVPIGFIFGSDLNADNATQVVDVNGDGISDIVHGFIDDDTSGLSESVYLGNGEGWEAATSTEWNLPYGIIDENDAGTQVYTFAQFVDLNGDGLTDVAFKHEDTGVGLRIGINNGHGWTLTNDLPGVTWGLPRPTESEDCLDSNQSDEGSRMMEVNGDGIVDFVYSIKLNGGATTSDVYINRYRESNDASFFSGGQNTVPLPFSYGCNVTTYTGIVDINADGMDDFLAAEKVGNVFEAHAYLSSVSPFADLLTSIGTSEGATSTIEYKLSTKYFDGNDDLLNPNLPIAVTTVSSITTDDGLGSESAETYSYADGFYYFNNQIDRKFAGFGLVERVDDVGNITKTYFHQGNESASSTGEYSDHISKAGKPYRVESYDSNNNLYSKTINKWDRADMGNGVSFVKLSDSVEFAYDGDSDHKEKASSLSYDNSTGNLTQSVEYGEVSGSNDGTFSDTGSDKFTTTLTYATSTATSTPFLYAISKEVVVDQSGGKVREKKVYYDTLSFGSITKGNPTKEEHWESGSSYVDFEKTYNSYGLVTQEKDPRDKTTTYSYDTYNLYPATSTNPLSQNTTFVYDYSSGKAKQIKDLNGYIFQTVFDGFDRVIEEKQPDLTTPTTLVTKSAYEYNDSGALPRTVHKTNYLNAATSTVAYAYFDGFGRVVQERNEAEDSGMFSVKDTKYNSIGKVLKESLPYFSSGASSTAATTTSALYINYEYDPLYRVTSIENAVGETTNAYDDWKLTVTDPNGEVKHLYKDAYDNLVRVDEINGGSTYTTSYEYDGNKNLTKITDSLSNIRNFTYDGLGRRLTAQDLHASGDSYFGTWYYAFDSAGNVASTTDPVSNNVVYTYDDVNRLTVENYTGSAGNEITNTYDSCSGGIGHLCVASSTSFRITNEYNPLGIIKREVKTIGGVSYATNYTNDRLGNSLTINHADGSVTTNDYNSAGQLERISWKETLASAGSSQIIKDIDYSPLGQHSYLEYGNNATTTSTYDQTELYRISDKETKFNTNKYQDLAYTYDDVGNVTKIIDTSSTDSAKTIDFIYDDLHRLTSASTTNAATSNYLETYSYNAIGNLTNKSDIGTYTYAGNNGVSFANPHAVTTVASNNATYDNNGNLLTLSSLSHTWNYRNELIQSASGTGTTTSTYDPAGERTSYTDTSGTTIYVNKFYNLLGDIYTKHIYANNELVATIVSEPDMGNMNTGEDDLGDVGTEGFDCCVSGIPYIHNIHYIHTDHLTGSNVTTDSNADLEETLDYYPFGKIRIDNTVTGFKEKHKYTGHIYDTQTDLNYMGARYQDGKRGQFLSQDPVFLRVGSSKKDLIVLVDPQKLNSYSYAINNPIRYTDPTGESIWDYANGFANAYLSNNAGGMGRVSPSSYNGNRVDYQKGQSTADVVSILQGIAEIGAGSTIATGGAVITVGSGGTLAIAGAPAAALGAGIATHGATVAGAGVYNFLDNTGGVSSTNSTPAGSQTNQSIAEKIASGHAGTDHIGDFAGLGITDSKGLAAHIKGVMDNPDVVKPLSNGRTVYGNTTTGTVVFHDPNSADGGTAFVRSPSTVRNYINRKK